MEKVLLGLLDSIDVHLPSGTKASTPQLEQKLNKALDGAQFISEVLSNPSESVQLNSLPLWNGGPLADAFQKTSIKESVMGIGDGAPEGADAFTGLRLDCYDAGEVSRLQD